jgi:hypothetical protein
MNEFERCPMLLPDGRICGRVYYAATDRQTCPEHPERGSMLLGRAAWRCQSCECAAQAALRAIPPGAAPSPDANSFRVLQQAHHDKTSEQQSELRAEFLKQQEEES